MFLLTLYFISDILYIGTDINRKDAIIDGYHKQNRSR